MPIAMSRGGIIMYEFEDTRRIIYGDDATFVPKCAQCGRFVAADETIEVTDQGLVDQPNATCAHCGRVQMIFEGFI